MPRKRTYGSGSLRKVGKIWWMRIRHEGRRLEESTGTSDRAEAMRLLTARLGDLAQGAEVLPSKATVGDLCNLVLADYSIRGLRDLKHAGNRYHKNIEPVLGSLKATDLTAEVLRKYVTDRRSAGASPASINRELAMVRRGFTLGRKESPPLVTSVPTFPRLEEDNARQGFLERQQYLDVLAEIQSQSLQALFVVAYHTGARKGELRKVKWHQVDWEGKRIHLPKKDTKAKKDRSVPIYGDMESWLRCQQSTAPKGNPYVFHGRLGRPIDAHLPGWPEAVEAAGRPGLLLHDLRRSAVRNMRKAGIPESVAMKISGHKTRDVFERYNITDDRDLTEAATKLEQYLGDALEVGQIGDGQIGEEIGDSSEIAE